MNAPSLLSEEMLERLCDHWQRAGAPLAESLRPGLSDDEMETTLAPLGLRLPTEARLWWSWHDGTDDERLSHGLGNDIVPLRLAGAVERYRQTLEDARVVTENDDALQPEDFWRAEWFPLACPRQALLACDCSVAQGQPTPIRHVEFYFHEESQEPVAPSLGAAVSLWIEALERRAWTYDHDQARWARHPERMPEPKG